MSDTEKPAAGTFKLLQRVILLVVGLVGIVFGGMRVFEGVNTIREAGENPAVTALLKESDKAIEEADAITKDVVASFQSLLDAVDTDGLDAVRKQKRELAEQIIDTFESAAAKARLGSSKLKETVSHKISDTVKPFIETKAKAYDAFALGYDKNRAIVELILDESFATVDDFLPKFNELVAERDAAQKLAVDLTTQAQATLKPSLAPAQ